MRLHFALTLFSLLSALVQTEPPRALPDVEFPNAHFVVPKEMPKEPAKGNPLLVPGVTYDVVVRVPHVLRTYPDGLLHKAVDVVKDKETLRVKGRYVDGSTVKSYTGPCTVYSFEAVADKSGQVQVVVIPLGLKREGDIHTSTVDVNRGPQPPPIVDPIKPEPIPPPTPVGPTAKRVSVVVIEETQDRTGSWPGKVLLDPTFREFLKAGNHELELVEKSDPRVKAAGYVPYADRAGYPAVLVFDADKTGPQLPLREFKLPQTAAEWKVKVSEAIKP